MAHNVVDNWRSLGEYDLATAQAMLDTRELFEWIRSRL
jgi:hypothetical protein